MKEFIFRIINVVGGKENILFNIRKDIKNSLVYILLIIFRNFIIIDTVSFIFLFIIR